MTSRAVWQVPAAGRFGRRAVVADEVDRLLPRPEGAISTHAQPRTPHTASTIPSALTFRTLRCRRERGPVRLLVAHPPIGWAPLVAQQPPGVGVRFPVVGRRRDRLLRGLPPSRSSSFNVAASVSSEPPSPPARPASHPPPACAHPSCALARLLLSPLLPRRPLDFGR